MNRFFWTLAVAAFSLASIHSVAQRANPAPTPPMGWNSWDAYGLTVTESQFRDNVAVLKKKLLPLGWQYAVIDEGWFFENPQDREKPDTLHYAIDPHGRYVPVPARFPSAVMLASNGEVVTKFDGPTPKLAATIEETSFVELGKFVHAQGLKFGIHIVRGIPRASVERNLPIEAPLDKTEGDTASAFTTVDAADTTDACPWDPTNWGVKDNAAGQAWYDSLLRQYAAWGVDLLKVDCIADHPYKVDEIRMIRRAIDKAGRPMVLSLSPGPTQLAHADEVSTLANMWRISDDEWDLWAAANDHVFPQGIRNQFARTAAWEKYAKPGDWPDADMLPWGELKPSPGWGKPRTSRLTLEEQRTQITLWSMARSPLILGANLTLLDSPTLKLLSNRDVLALDQDSTGSAEVLHEGDLVVWKSNLADGRHALALFNLGETPLQVDRSYSALAPDLGTTSWSTKDAWTGKQLGKRSSVSTSLAPHACLLLMLR